MAEDLRPSWDNATWAGAEEARRKVDARMTFREKLDWNARALELARRLKPSGEEGYRERAAAEEDWSEWDTVAGDGLEQDG